MSLLLRRHFRDWIFIEKNFSWCSSGFDKTFTQTPTLIYKNRDKLSPPWFGVPTGYLPEIHHHTCHRTLQVPLVTIMPPLILTLYFIIENFARTPRSVAFPTVHDRGLDYSNRLTLCRGGALSPHHKGLHRGSSHGLPDDNTSNIGTLIKTFHYVHANKKVPLQLGGFPWHRLILILGIRPPRQGT